MTLKVTEEIDAQIRLECVRIAIEYATSVHSSNTIFSRTVVDAGALACKLYEFVSRQGEWKVHLNSIDPVDMQESIQQKYQDIAQARRQAGQER